MKKKLLIGLLALFGCLGLYAQDAQKQQVEKLRKEIAELDRQLKANEGKSADATAQLALTRKKMEASRQLVSQSEKEVAQLSRQIRQKNAQIAQTQKDLDENLSYYQSLIKSAYLSRDPKLRFLYVISGESIAQVVRRFNYLRTASDNLRDEAKAIAQRKEILEREKVQLDSLQKRNRGPE